MSATTNTITNSSQLLDAFCNVLSGLKEVRPALTLTTVECFHIGRNAADRITELEAQQSDLRQLQTALATGQPVWPNNWSQPVAMVAYEFHLRQEQLAEAQRDAWQPIETAPNYVPVLVFHNRMVIEAWYSTPWGKFVVSETGGSNLIKPTHWMPLPKPPIAGEAT